MELENNLDLIQDAIKSYIKELSTTKKGKCSYRKYKKNRSTIFAACSLATDIETEKNKDRIAEEVRKYLDQFVNTKEINLGDKLEFEISKSLYGQSEDNLSFPHIDYKV